MSEQRVALVTGSSSGIGAAVARRLAEAGIRVVVTSARSVEAGERLAAELPGAVYLQADVSDETQAKELVERAVERLGRLDILVNCAGTTLPHSLKGMGGPPPSRTTTSKPPRPTCGGTSTTSTPSASGRPSPPPSRTCGRPAAAS
ncbi:SDR family NAD(P)-dependent oxidoreductase [Streptomyces gardneri]|uniref:SDR family NAD(P)-dependent oxidoreductase n=1 Tax=Streptomyces gardneri TaxID=66892 RepID=UPI0040642F5A